MRLAHVIPALVCAGLLAGCRGPGVPTAMDQQAILAVLVEYEASRGAEPVWASQIRPEIRAKGNRVWAKYKKCRATEQIVFAPIVVQLQKRGTSWVVVSEEGNWPWWWHVVNYTVGVK